MNTMTMLIKREFWENRSLYIAPLVIAGLIVLSSAWAVVAVHDVGHDSAFTSAQSLDDVKGLSDDTRAELQEYMAFPDDRKATPYAASILIFAAALSAITCIVVFFYLIDCLYAERRDRSILFWKSMPMSDTQVVLSKLVVAMLIVPVGVLVLSAVTQLLVSLVFWLRFHDTLVHELVPGFSLTAWARSQWVTVQMAIGGVLWYAPIAGYLVFVSAWARRLVFLWAVLPPLALALFEVSTTHTTYVFEFLGQRFAGFLMAMDFNTDAFEHQAGDVQMPSINTVFDALSLKGMFLHPEMWLGLAAGAALVFAAIRMRRYRDES
jgi:ABC-2 type transport system permease protein